VSQSNLIGALVAVVVILVGALMYTLGRQSAFKEEDKVPIGNGVASVLKPPATVEPVKPLVPPANRVLQNVEVGLDGPDFDACGSSGRPKGLDPDGDNFLAVKAAPSLNSERLDQLGPGDEFYMCQSVQQGRWTGIVYSTGGGLSARCGVTSPVQRRRAYSGPCKSGWVYSKYVELVAG
jgi:hypothetical protein